MRILAIFAFFFAAGVFGANYLIPEGGLIFAGLLSGTGGAALWFWSHMGRRRRLFWTLASAGLAAGLLWTALYGAVVFQPARELDDRTVKVSGSRWTLALLCGNLTAATAIAHKLSSALYCSRVSADGLSYAIGGLGMIGGVVLVAVMSVFVIAARGWHRKR